MDTPLCLLLISFIAGFITSEFLRWVYKQETHSDGLVKYKTTVFANKHKKDTDKIFLISHHALSKSKKKKIKCQ